MRTWVAVMLCGVLVACGGVLGCGDDTGGSAPAKSGTNNGATNNGTTAGTNNGATVDNTCSEPGLIYQCSCEDGRTGGEQVCQADMTRSECECEGVAEGGLCSQDEDCNPSRLECLGGAYLACGRRCERDDQCGSSEVCAPARFSDDQRAWLALADRYCAPAGKGDGESCQSYAECNSRHCIQASAGDMRCATFCREDDECGPGGECAPKQGADLFGHCRLAGE